MAEKEKKSAIEFDTPDGMELSEDTKEGDEFDALATLKIGKDGKLTLLAIDGYSMPEEESESEDKGESGEEPAKGENPKFADVVASKMASYKNS